jgi:membrane protein
MKLNTFLKKNIWHVPLARLPKWKAFTYRSLRVILLTLRGFTKSQIQQGASSLTYYSLLAIVPIIAILIGIARGFNFEKALEAWALHQFSDQKEVIQRIFIFASESIAKANGGVIAGIGTAILIWSALKILINIEFVMNQIWEVQKGRSFTQRFTDYIALLFVAPIIIFLSSGLTGYVSGFIGFLSKENYLARFLAPLLNATTILLNAILFTFLYVFIPNTRVKLRPSILAGIFTAIAYQILQWVYFYFQIGVAKYNAIYGTFAAFPLFLIWLHLSWVIVLLGAKVCFSLQNVDAYEFIAEDVHLSQKIRLICSLRIAHLCIKLFAEEKPPMTIVEISNALSIPLLLTSQLIYQLVSSNVLIEVKREKDQEDSYQPGRNIERLTIKRVIDMIQESGETIPLHLSKDLSSILKSLHAFNSTIEQSDANLLLKDI